MKQRNQSGDTLIEVAIAIAMLGLVVTTVFMTANRSLATIMDATERTAVRASINSQLDMIEYLRDRDPDSTGWKRILRAAKSADSGTNAKLVDEIYQNDCKMRSDKDNGSMWLEYNPSYDVAKDRGGEYVQVYSMRFPNSSIKEQWDREKDHKDFFKSVKEVAFDKLDTQISTAPIPGHGIWIDVVKSEAKPNEHEGRYIEIIARACWSPLGSRKVGQGRIKVIKRFSIAGEK